MSGSLRERLYGSYVSSEHARVPEALSGLRGRDHYLRRLVKAHFPPRRDAAVLDLGCGHGALVRVARRFGYANTRGVDVSQEQVDAAARLGIDGVEQGDLLEALIAQGDQSLDVVAALDVLEHFGKGELLELVDQVHRVLRPGGRWIIHVPNGESPFFGAIRYGDLTHEVAFTRSSISQLLRSAGFGSVACHEDEPIVHGLKSAVRLALWKAIRLGLSVYVASETGEVRGHIFSRNLLAVATR